MIVLLVAIVATITDTELQTCLLAAQTSGAIVLDRTYCPWCACATTFGAAFDEQKARTSLAFLGSIFREHAADYTHEGDVGEEWQLGARCSGTLPLPPT